MRLWNLSSMVRKFLQYLLCSLTVRLSLIFKKNQIVSRHFFAKQRTLVSNNNVLLREFTYMTEECIHVNKAHGHNNISVSMTKLCTNSVAHPLTLIFQNSLVAGTFATHWKRANIVPIQNKNDKQIVSNYRPVSLGPICSEIFEKLIFNELFKFFEDKNLLSKHQSGYLNINRVFTRVIHVFINYLQSFMTSFRVLIAITLYRLGVCSLTYLKRLIELDTMDYYVSINQKLFEW